ncbi:MAG: dihydropteroate synthase [Deltaproteobacteria bacterium]|nr:dihydropteroate synthase [Deltaproteobacteria bacterium]
MGRFPVIRLRHGAFLFERTLVMGIVNVTPDSFSDGGVFFDVDSAVAHGLALVAQGADCLDVGGESTRPGARPVSEEEELARVLPVVSELASRAGVPISIDTTKARVAARAIGHGADVVNDISGGLYDPDVIRVADDMGAAYVLGHLRGRTLAETHQAIPPTFDEAREELANRLSQLPAGLVARTLIDPGLGFGKGTRENLELIRRCGELGTAIDRPVVIGASRKRFLGELTGRPLGDRDDATVGACLAASLAGADMVRVHDVKRVHDALVVFEAITRGATRDPDGIARGIP